MEHITTGNLERLLDSGRIAVCVRYHGSNKWWRIRRNGVTRRWKRNARRFRIPYKAGLYLYGALTEADFLPNGHLLRHDLYRYIPDA